MAFPRNTPALVAAITKRKQHESEDRAAIGAALKAEVPAGSTVTWKLRRGNRFVEVIGEAVGHRGEFLIVRQIDSCAGKGKPQYVKAEALQSVHPPVRSTGGAA